MTISELKSKLCEFFNGCFSIPFIQVPTNTPAPVGLYVAVDVTGVEQSGSLMQPQAGTAVPFVTQQVATIAFTEVEGNGDSIRGVRNEIQSKNFIEYAHKNGFSVWDFTSIMPIDTYDGKFYVRQWRFTCRVNFEDVKTADVPNIATVDPLTLEGR